MAKLTNIKERIHWVLQLDTPEHNMMLGNDNSMVIQEIAVPPTEFVKPYDVLRVRVGSWEPLFEAPLQWLMDQYHPKFEQVWQVYYQIEGQLSVLIDAILEHQYTDDEVQVIDKVRRLHQEMHEAMPKAKVGIELKRALILPPRQTLTVSTEKGSAVTVYLSGLRARTIC